ncbi:unnamed protein product [Boreogadus saida]
MEGHSQHVSLHPIPTPGPCPLFGPARAIPVTLGVNRPSEHQALGRQHICHTLTPIWRQTVVKSFLPPPRREVWREGGRWPGLWSDASTGKSTFHTLHYSEEGRH